MTYTLKEAEEEVKDDEEMVETRKKIKELFKQYWRPDDDNSTREIVRRCELKYS